MGSRSWALPTNRTPAPRPPTTRHTPSTGRPTQRSSPSSIGGSRTSAKVADQLAGADPTDLGGLREALGRADPQGRLAPIGMSRIEIGADALSLLPEVVSELAGGGREAPRVVLATDETPMRRADGDPKYEAEHLLAVHFEVRRAVLGEGRTQLHADERARAEAEDAVRGADCVGALGSGTAAGVCKAATARVGSPPLVVVQTAASVNAFSDDVAVLLKSGTKRPVPSRWPDALLVDLTTLADAPPAMNLAGFGDRKSTRLNSSHANISYAVFCLKKKKYYTVIIKPTHPELHLVLCLFYFHFTPLPHHPNYSVTPTLRTYYPSLI